VNHINKVYISQIYEKSNATCSEKGEKIIQIFFFFLHDLSQQCMQSVMGNCGCVFWCKCTDVLEVLYTSVVREVEHLVVDFKSVCIYFIYLYS
jgi:hypothetical protein